MTIFAETSNVSQHPWLTRHHWRSRWLVSSQFPSIQLKLAFQQAVPQVCSDSQISHNLDYSVWLILMYYFRNQIPLRSLAQKVVQRQCSMWCGYIDWIWPEIVDEKTTNLTDIVFHFMFSLNENSQLCVKVRDPNKRFQTKQNPALIPLQFQSIFRPI